MKRYWLDVTGLMNSQGVFTGCTRVEYEIFIREFRNKNFGAIYFDENTQTIREIDIKPFLTLNGKSAIEYIRIKYKNTNSKYKIVNFFRNSKIVSAPISNGDTVVTVGIHATTKFIQELQIYRINSDIKLVTYIHDLICVTHPQYSNVASAEYRYRKFYTDMLFFSDLILVNSEFTKNQIMKFTKNNLSLEIVKLGDNKSETSDSNLSDDEKQFAKIIKKFKYLLYVSTLEPRKNHELILKVYMYAESINSLEKLPIIYFVGKQGWGDSSWQEILKANWNLKDKIIILENVSDPLLRELYINCIGTIYPSFIEGWGLPIRESLYYGKPSIISNQSSMVEHRNSGLIHLNPFDVVSWFNEIINFVENPPKVNDFSPRTWEDFYRDFADSVYNLTRQDRGVIT